MWSWSSTTSSVPLALPSVTSCLRLFEKFCQLIGYQVQNIHAFLPCCFLALTRLLRSRMRQAAGMWRISRDVRMFSHIILSTQDLMTSISHLLYSTWGSLHPGPTFYHFCPWNSPKSTSLNQRVWLLRDLPYHLHKYMFMKTRMKPSKDRVLFGEIAVCVNTW